MLKTLSILSLLFIGLNLLSQDVTATKKEAINLSKAAADSLAVNPNYSIQLLQKAVAWFNQNPNSDEAALAYNRLGFAFSYLSKIDSAEYYFQESSISYFNLQKYDHAIESQKDFIAGTLLPAGKFQQALSLALKIKEKTKKSTDPKLIYLTNEIFINIYWDLDDFIPELLELAIETEELAYELGDSTKMEKSGFYLASAYGKNGKRDMSIDTYKKIIEIQLARNDNHVSAAYNNVGTQFLELKMYDSAIYYLQKGQYYSLLENRMDGVAAARLKIGYSYGHMGQLDKSLQLCTEALDLLKEANIIRRQESCVECIYSSLQGLDRKAEAFDWLLLHNELKDSLLSNAEEKELRTMQNSFNQEIESLTDSLNFEHSKNLQQEKIEDQQKRSILLYIGLGLSILFGGFILNRFRITRKQKTIIELQKIEVAKKHHELQESHKEITDSITYAKRIQTAILPSADSVAKLLGESFVLYLPKDVVAGDFYWMEATKEGVVFAAADCTGHGVPGAMVSVVCNNALNRAVKEFSLTEPAKILDKTREIVVNEFQKSGKDVKDGMDIALCKLSNNTLMYSGAHNPLWILRSGEIIEIKGDKQPIGAFDTAAAFTNHEIELQKDDLIYIFSDGYVDQFGGENGKKLKAKNMRDIFSAAAKLKISEQAKFLESQFEAWKGDYEQIDDVCVIGVRIC